MMRPRLLFSVVLLVGGLLLIAVPASPSQAQTTPTAQATTTTRRAQPLRRPPRRRPRRRRPQRFGRRRPPPVLRQPRRVVRRRRRLEPRRRPFSPRVARERVRRPWWRQRPGPHRGKPGATRNPRRHRHRFRCRAGCERRGSPAALAAHPLARTGRSSGRRGRLPPSRPFGLTSSPGSTHRTVGREQDVNREAVERRSRGGRAVPARSRGRVDSTLLRVEFPSHFRRHPSGRKENP